MTMPAPPSDQSPWGPPPAGFPAPPPPVGQQPRNGMGITALVLGTIGAVLGLAVFLFWISWLPALLALVFGIVGLGHARKGLATNKAMALTGLVLGAAGLLLAVGGGVFTFSKVAEFTDGIRSDVETAEAEADAAEASAAASAKAEASASAAAEEARNLAFGETYTYENGLKVTVSGPRPFVPDEFAFGHPKGNKAVEVTVTVVNGGSEKTDLKTGLPRVGDADGADAELLIDGSGRQKVLTGMLLPGKRAVGKYAFSLPAGAADRIRVTFSPDLMKYDDAFWSGPAT
ncbi:DUF4190 domain-containing protein [Streptomyces sp. Wb2n-11]|uniref:DUF4190 domain-containing protein n=1 Tax=Streptomyces sp. Wb2n-11 TaxID=1030533 RepID=UPI000ACBC852|nr:DUF4190 domain-containing protein [Streptomyces sp. Wb2n-11]